MKYRLLHILMITALLPVVFFACSQNDDLQLEDNSSHSVVVSIGISTRVVADATQPGDGLPEDLKVWVYGQKADESEDQYTRLAYIPKAGNLFIGKDIQGNPMESVEEVIENAKDYKKLYFYVVVNSGSVVWPKSAGTSWVMGEKTTIAELKEARFTGIMDGKKDNQLLMYGEGSVMLTRMTSYSLEVNVERAVSKLELYMSKTSEGFDLEIDKVTLKQLPRQGYLKSRTMEGLKTEGAINTSDNVSIFSGGLAIDATSPDHIYGEATAVPLTGPFMMENPYGDSSEGAKGILVEPEENETTDDEKLSYHLTIEYKINRQEYAQTIRLPQIKRNTINKIYCWVNNSGKSLILSFATAPWVEKTESWDYTDQVSIKENGMMRWEAYDRINSQTGEVYFQAMTHIKGFFNIDTPNGTWYATLVPVSGNPSAFQFVGNAFGKVGEPAVLEIATRDDMTQVNNMAKLQIVVKTKDGRTLNADLCGNNYPGVTNFILVQPKN